MKKIVLIISLFLGLCACSSPTANNMLDIDKVNLEVYYHQFDEIENDHNIWLIACYININDENVDLDKMSVEIDGIKQLGNINDELTNNTKYTSDYCDERIILEYPSQYIKQYYVIETDLNKSTIGPRTFGALVTYENKTMRINPETLAGI